jgi:1-deoxy-D-xylulose-5-phosphate reductoisomerase
MDHKIKRLAILGSTGSIGIQTLDIIRNHPDKFKVVGLAAGKNTGLLKTQAAEFRPNFIYSIDSENLPSDIRHLPMDEIACQESVDLVIVATTGKAGLNSTLAAIHSGKALAIANKEVLVMAGEIITAEARKHHCRILPIDSEHSAIWQCLNGENNGISRILLTASGGPFYGYDAKRLACVTVKETLSHPTWKMGKKVTVDSATLMNKGLETIEAKWLFDVQLEKIEVIIHRQSIIHSMVEFIDGSVKAQLSFPDMRLPIQYALSFPDRINAVNFKMLDFGQVKNLTFEPVKFDSFPCLALAIDAGKTGGTYPAVACAADEVAVDFFLNNKIKFTSISNIILDVINAHKNIDHPSLDEILEADGWARTKALEIIIKRIL